MLGANMKLKTLLNEITYSIKDIEDGPVRSFKYDQIDDSVVIKDPKLLQNCYENALNEFDKRIKLGENVQYYLGNMKSKGFPYPIGHGWVVKDFDIVIDITPTYHSTDERGYIINFNEVSPKYMCSFKEMYSDLKYVGRPLKQSYVLAAIKKGGPSITLTGMKDPIPYEELHKFYDEIHNFEDK